MPDGPFTAEDFEQPAAPPEESSWARRWLADPALWAAKGIIGVPEAAVGLLDIPTLGYTGKLLEAGGYGFQPKIAREYLQGLESPEARAAQQRFAEAEGVWGKTAAAFQNPSVIASTAVESLPSMFAGGAIAKGLRPALGLGEKAIRALSPAQIATRGALAAGIGEGAVTAGQVAEQIREESPEGVLTPKQAALSLGAGTLTGGIGAVSGKIAARLGIEQLDLLASGVKSEAAAAARRQTLGRVIGGAITEGLLEELPQSIQEQVMQNLAQGKPWDAGMADNAVLGALTGGILGAAANLRGQKRESELPPGQKRATGKIRAASALPAERREPVGRAATGEAETGIAQPQGPRREEQPPPSLSEEPPLGRTPEEILAAANARRLQPATPATGQDPVFNYLRSIGMTPQKLWALPPEERAKIMQAATAAPAAAAAPITGPSEGERIAEEARRAAAQALIERPAWTPRRKDARRYIEILTFLNTHDLDPMQEGDLSARDRIELMKTKHDLNYELEDLFKRNPDWGKLVDPNITPEQRRALEQNIKDIGWPPAPARPAPEGPAAAATAETKVVPPPKPVTPAPDLAASLAAMGLSEAQIQAMVAAAKAAEAPPAAPAKPAAAVVVPPAVPAAAKPPAAAQPAVNLTPIPLAEYLAAEPLQSRAEPFAEVTAAKVAKEGWNPAESAVTPPLVWRDPVTGKLYRSQGSSRAEGLRRLMAAGRPVPATIDALFIPATDRKGAVMAAISGNLKSAQETFVDTANAVVWGRQEGFSDAEIAAARQINPSEVPGYAGFHLLPDAVKREFRPLGNRANARAAQGKQVGLVLGEAVSRKVLSVEDIVADYESEKGPRGNVDAFALRDVLESHERYLNALAQAKLQGVLFGDTFTPQKGWQAFRGAIAGKIKQRRAVISALDGSQRQIKAIRSTGRQPSAELFTVDKQNQELKAQLQKEIKNLEAQLLEQATGKKATPVTPAAKPVTEPKKRREPEFLSEKNLIHKYGIVDRSTLKKEAKESQRKLIEGLIAEWIGRYKANPTFANLFPIYLYYQINNSNHKALTYINYISSANRLLTDLEELQTARVDKLTDSDVNRLFAKLQDKFQETSEEEDDDKGDKRAGSTYNARMYAFQGALRVTGKMTELRDLGIAPQSYAADNLKPMKTGDYYFPLQLAEPGKLQGLLDKILGLPGEFAKQAADLAELIGYTGLRFSEVANIRWRDVHLDTNTIRITNPAKDTFGEKPAYDYAMPLALQNTLARMQRENPGADKADFVSQFMVGDNLKRRVHEFNRRYISAASIALGGFTRADKTGETHPTWITSKDLRHLWISLAAKYKLDPLFVDQQHGRRKPKGKGATSRGIYTHFLGDAQEEIKKLRFGTRSEGAPAVASAAKPAPAPKPAAPAAAATPEDLQAAQAVIDRAMAEPEPSLKFGEMQLLTRVGRLEPFPSGEGWGDEGSKNVVIVQMPDGTDQFFRIIGERVTPAAAPAPAPLRPEDEATLGGLRLGVSKSQWTEMAGYNDAEQMKRYGTTRAKLIEQATLRDKGQQPPPSLSRSNIELLRADARQAALGTQAVRQTVIGALNDPELMAAVQQENRFGFKVETISFEELQRKMKARGWQPMPTGTSGTFFDGTIWLVPGLMTSAEEAVLAFREEAAHGLLRSPRGQRLMLELNLRLTDEEKDALRRAGYTGFSDPQLNEEFLAKSGIRDQPWWKDLINRVLEFFQRLGLHIDNATAARVLMRTLQEDLVRSQANVAPSMLRASNATVISPQLRPGQAITAYHGTGAEVDRFATGQIGTGEGSQVYGWGLYFAENPEVALHYRTQQGKPTPETGFLWHEIMRRMRERFPKADARWKAEDILDTPESERLSKFPEITPEDANYVARYARSMIGNVYTVSLNANPEDFLDWDRPLNEQSPKVQTILAANWEELVGISQRRQMFPVFNYKLNPSKTGEQIYHDLSVLGEKEASEWLAKRGIKGVRFQDQGSRSGPYIISTHADRESALRSATKGDFVDQLPNGSWQVSRQTNNYVVFNENDIAITHQNGEQVSFNEAAKPGDGDEQQPAPSLSDFFNPKADTPTDEGDDSTINLAGVTHPILGLDRFTPADKTKAAARVVELFERLKIPGHADTSHTPLGATHTNMVWIVDPSEAFPDVELAVNELYKEVAKQIQIQHQPAAGGDMAYVSQLINAIHKNHNAGNWAKIISLPLEEKLLMQTAAESSLRGQLLRSLTGMGKGIEVFARNLDFYLHRILSEEYGGPAVQKLMARVMENFRKWFTEKELDDFANSASSKDAKDRLQAIVTRVQGLNRREEGGRVFKFMQRLLKEKFPKTVARMEADARVMAAVEDIIEKLRNPKLNEKNQKRYQELQARMASNIPLTPEEATELNALHDLLIPVVPKPPKGKTKLTALETLVYMVDEETVEKVKKAVNIAIHDGYMEAGKTWALGHITDPEEQKQRAEDFELGGEPTTEEIEEGLKHPDFAHFRILHDNLIPYEPITLMHAERIVGEEFRNTRFDNIYGVKIERPADDRVDLQKLAQDPEAEKRRVIDAKIANIQANLGRMGVDGKTMSRILQSVSDVTHDQLAKAQKRVLDNFLEPPERMPAVTPEEKINRLLNAGLAKDDRFTSTPVVNALTRIATRFTTSEFFDDLAGETREEKLTALETVATEIVTAVENAKGGEVLKNLAPDDPFRLFAEQVILNDLYERLQKAENRLIEKLAQGKDVPLRPEPTDQETIVKRRQGDRDRLERFINAGATQAGIDDLVEKQAAQSVLPTLNYMIRQALNTPVSRESDIYKVFVDQLIHDLDIDEATAALARQWIEKAYKAKFRAARGLAYAQAVRQLVPHELREISPSKARWKRIEEAVHAGAMDDSSVLEEIAQHAGNLLPVSDAVRVKIKNLVERIDQLQVLNAKEWEKIKNDPEAIQLATTVKKATTESEVIALRKQLETQWARIVSPLNLKTRDGRENFFRGAMDWTSANLLFRFGFVFKQAQDVFSQLLFHTPTRALAPVFNRYVDAKLRQGVVTPEAKGTPAFPGAAPTTKAGAEPQFWSDAYVALRDAYKVRFAHWRETLASAALALKGQSDARNVDRLLSQVATFQRIEERAKEAKAKGNDAIGFMWQALGAIELSYRIAIAYDNLHGTPAEWQELRQQAMGHLRQTMPAQAASLKLDEVLGDAKQEWLLALETAKSIFAANGLEPSPTKIRGAAGNIAKARAYAKLRTMGMPVDDFMEQSRVQRNLIGWNEKEAGYSAGGVVASATRGARELSVAAGGSANPFLAALGLTGSLFNFGNAIGIAINRVLSFTPLGFSPRFFGVEKEAITRGTSAVRGSPWYRTHTDRTQRKLEAAVGTSFGALFFTLAATGLLRVRNKWPKDKEEREAFERQGHRPGTVEVPLGDGFIALSLSSGPLAILRPYLAAGGAVLDLTEDRAKAQARINAEAERDGTIPGKLPPPTYGDYMGVAGQAVQSAVLGGRTASGLIGSFSDYGIPNPKKLAATVVSPYLPGLPALQEVTRMAGVRLDAKMASFGDFLLPLPTSGAVAVNMLGDRVGTENDLQRVIQVLSGGNYPYVPNQDNNESAPYRVLFDTGYRPPPISSIKGYNINGERRPMTDDELVRYSKLRGEYLKQELSALGPGATKADARAAYQSANQKALEQVGVSTERAATASTAPSTRSAGYAGPSAGPGSYGGAPAYYGGGSSRGGARRIRSAFGRVRLSGSRRTRIGRGRLRGYVRLGQRVRTRRSRIRQYA